MNNANKELMRYMQLPYTVMLQRDEEGDFIARVKELEGCVADGQDEIEAIGNLNEVKEFWFRAALKAGRNIPPPDSIDADLPSGKWLMRVPRTLHKKLVEMAEQEGVSLNQFALSCLAEAVGEKTAASKNDASVAGRLDRLMSSAQSGYRQSSIHVVSADKPKLSALEQEQAMSFLRNALGKESFVFGRSHDEVIGRTEVEEIAV
jgi:antitoxin HicB